MMTMVCPECGLVLQGSTLSEVVFAKKDHRQQRHLDGEIETDT